MFRFLLSSFFFFNDPPTTEIYTLSLHDALPICLVSRTCADFIEVKRYIFCNDLGHGHRTCRRLRRLQRVDTALKDRKSTRLNSSHVEISYAVFCLKKKKKKQNKNNRKQSN